MKLSLILPIRSILSLASVLKVIGSLVAAGAGAAAAGYAVDYACTGLLLNWWFFVYLFKYEY